MNNKTDLQAIKSGLESDTAGMTFRQRQQFMLAQCESAIQTIMTGAQSYTIAGQSLTRASLADLQKWRLSLIASLSGGRRMSQVSFSSINTR